MSEIIYRAAEYYRLSHTDDKSSESDSIANQRKQLKTFIDSQSDIESVSEWVDDGVSGILFDRPSFKQMMEEVESGKVNCIIVKDLSRFGREYIETGRYLRRILPAYGVRFIAINDGVDTLKDSGDDLIISIKTVMNDAYCRDISVKTRSALNVKRENGDYVGACPVYGYRKSDDNNNLLVIDEYPASVVRDIFRMKIEGLSALKISESLNNLGVLSPLEYKKDRGLPHPKGGYGDIEGAKWSPNTILRIINDETYTGTLVQGRQGTYNYKIKDLVDKPKNEWKRVENTHDAIISRQDFVLARRISRLDTRSTPGGNSVYLFSGILICGSCGARMTRKAVPYKGEKYHYYYCPTTKKRGCEKATMLKEDVLHEHVLKCVKAQIINVISIDTIMAGSDKQQALNALSRQYLMQITENENKLAELTGFRATLYESMVTGMITKNEYASFKAQYNTDEARIRDAISLLQQQNEDALTGKCERLRWIEQFKNFESLTDLDRRAVVNLIKSIRVVNKKELHITFNYQADFDKAHSIISEEAA
jgi:DNA invertase Pin-like site-specific DNA recombinase